MKTGRPKSKVIKKQFAAYLEPELYAQCKILLAQNNTSFTAELTKWVKHYIKSQTPVDKPGAVEPVAEVPLTKIEVPSFVGKKAPTDWF